MMMNKNFSPLTIPLIYIYIYLISKKKVLKLFGIHAVGVNVQRAVNPVNNQG